jgi:hypothetical protein
MFNLGGMKAGVFFVAAIVAFNAAPVFSPGESDRPRQNDARRRERNTTSDSFTRCHGTANECAGAGFRATAHIGYAATLNEFLIVQDTNPPGGC